MQWQRLGPDLGAGVPEEVREAGVGGEFERALEISQAEYERLAAAGLEELAPYALSLAFRIRYVLDLNAREAMRLIELRAGREGHPSYRAIARELHSQIARVHPYGTSAYGELAGGIPGAATLGMQRQYWSNNVTAVLPWLNRHCPPGARVYFHEVNVESYRTYLLTGQLRADIRYALVPEQSDYAALQWHREFRDREPETWNAYGTRRPATGLYLDEVPQVVVYARPGLPGAPKI